MQKKTSEFLKNSEVSTPCFAVRRGEITRSLHSEYYHPERRLAIKAIQERWKSQSSSLGNVLNFDERLAQYQSNLFYVGLANIESETGLFVETDEQEPEGTCRLFTKGNILYGKLRPYLNKVYIAPRDGQCSTELYALSAIDTEKLDHSFLAAFLMSKPFLSQTIHMMTGNTHPRIQREDFEEIVIPLPDLKTQRSLVAEMEAAHAMRQSKLAEAESLLNNIDDIALPTLGIEPFEEKHRSVYSIKLGKIDNRLDAYANQPRFHKLRKMLKEKYSAVEIGSIALEIFSGTTPLAGGDAYTDEVDGIPFVRSGEITSDGLVSESHDVFLKEEVHNTTMKRSQLKKDDLLIAIVGATIGAVGVYKSDKPANINQAIAAVRLPTEKVLPEFVTWYLKSSIGQGILDFLKRPVARANINLEEIGQILIPIPSLDIQRTIIKDVQSRRAQARQLRAEAESMWQKAKEKFERELLG